MSDTATRLSSVNARPSPAQQAAYYDSRVNGIHEAVVIRVGMFENYESAVYVSVRGFSEQMKVEAALGNAASAATGTGSWCPYFVGDKVLVAFLYGDTNRPFIIGRAFDQTGLSEYILQEDLPFPQRGKKAPSGKVVRPSPIVQDPSAIKEAGMVSITSYPMIVI